MTTKQKRAIGYAIRAKQEKKRRAIIHYFGLDPDFEESGYKTTRGYLTSTGLDASTLDVNTGTRRRYYVKRGDFCNVYTVFYCDPGDIVPRGAERITRKEAERLTRRERERRREEPYSSGYASIAIRRACDVYGGEVIV